jgi:tripartite-type tricarboxylate transporter receptor subunit TctC
MTKKWLWWSVAPLFLCASAYLHAQGYPRGPISLVIPLAPGDAADIAARMMAEELSRLVKVPVIPINRPGAGGVVGNDSVVKAAKDGQTILFTVSASLTFRRILEPDTVSYDPLKDFTPLGMATRSPSIVTVRDDAPFRSFGEMVAFEKKNPGKVRVGTVGIGSAGDFAVRIMNTLAGTDITMVPFKGASPAVTALKGGHIEGVALALGALSGELKSGAMRGIIFSSKFPEFPNVPTLSDLGYTQNIIGVWFAFFAPAGVPAEVSRVLVPAIEKVVTNPAIGAKLLPLGIAAEYQPPEKVLAEIREETRTVEAIAKKAGLVK